MSTEEIDLTQVYLGLYPYVLVEVHPDGADEAGFDLRVKSGGGIGSTDEIVSVLLLLVESLTGVPTDVYTLLVDRRRDAA